MHANVLSSGRNFRTGFIPTRSPIVSLPPCWKTELPYAPSNSSCTSWRNRACPKEQANARARWLQARRQELLPTRYVHVVFTLPHELAPLALQNKNILYHLLLQTSAATLLEVARDPKHLGAELGFFRLLHTSYQKLEH